MTVLIIELMLFMPIAFVDAITISDVRVSHVSDSFARITWNTDDSSNSTVNYGTSAALGQVKSDSSILKNHSILLTGLSRSTSYLFSVSSWNATDDNGGNLYNLTTIAQDDAAPEINANIPAYINSKLVDIVGDTEPLTKIFLYVNGVYLRKQDPEETGIFRFNSVSLETFRIPNVIRITAEDAAGNTNEKSFDIIVDTEAPVLQVNNISDIANTSTVNIKGTVSENSTVEIVVNNNSILKQDMTSFNINADIEEGRNEIKITAADRAGNTDEFFKIVYKDTEPPKLEDIEPKSGAFFYETDPVTDISGKTEPNAKVRLYINKQLSGNPDAETTADKNGNFNFKDINLQKGFAISGRAGFITVEGAHDQDTLPVQPPEVYEASEINNAGEQKPNEQNVDIYIVAIDSVGLSVQDSVSYTIGTCFSGNMAWNIENFIEFQAPTSISPERMTEGTEIITFVLNMSYQGIGTEPAIKSVRFRRACEASSMLSDPRFNLSCKVFPNSPSVAKSNDKKTAWYVRYDLSQFEGLDTFTDDVWKDLAKDMVFPVKVEIEYSHKIDGKEVTEVQVKCMNFAYHLDKTRIDPRDVLPDWLRKDGLKLLNESIQRLNQIIPIVEKVNRYAAVACIAGFALKIITFIWRTWQSWMDYIDDKALADDNNEKCPLPGPAKRSYPQKDKKTQVDLSEEELGKRCPNALNAWKTEAEVYEAYRWACDRFLCRSTPAKWTEGQTYADVRTKIQEGLLCAEKTGTQGTILKKNTDCSSHTSKDVCYEYKGSYYIYDGQGLVADPDNPAGGKVYYKLTPYNNGAINPLSKPLYVTLESGNAFLENKDKTCAYICKTEKKWDNGKVMKKDEYAQLLKQNYKTSEPVGFKTSDTTNDKMCYCFGKSTPVTEALKAKPGVEWNYRDDKTRAVVYDTFIYYEGRDQSACFGQNNWFYQDSPYLNKGDFIPAFQCACVSQVRNRLVQLRNILQGAYGCLQQIDKTGKADSGVCKEIFTQYICKWIYQLINYLMKGCMPWTGTGKDTDITDYFQAGSNAIFGGVQEAADDFMSDYDNEALKDYLGAGEGTIAEKVCLGALTGDWGFDLEGLMDAAYSQPYHTSAAAYPATRDYMTWNPYNQQATFDYRIAWMILPGCDIDSYQVSLVCASDHDMRSNSGVLCEKTKNKNKDVGTEYNSLTGCDCVSTSGSSTNQTGKYRVIYNGGRLSQGSLEDKSISIVQEAPFRYDSIRIDVYVNDPKVAEKCIPPENLQGRKGVFYSPISDITSKDIAACRFDQNTGLFVCSKGQFLWEERGRAYFGSIECESADKKCEDSVYYLNDELKFSKFEVISQGKKQCLYVETRNGHQQVVNKGYQNFDYDQNNPSAWVVNKVPPNLLPGDRRITLTNFGQMPATYTVSEFGADQRPATDISASNIIDGSHSIYFFDDNKDGYADEYSTEGPMGTRTVLRPDALIYIGGMPFRFSKPRVAVTSKCGTTIENCKEYKFNIQGTREIATTEEQTWYLHLELRHAPGEDNSGDCRESTPNDVITYQGVRQVQEIKIRVNPLDRQTAGTCHQDGITSNTNICDCNNDNKKDGVFDCDSAQNRLYCYKHNDNLLKCEKEPACNPGNVQNSGACDCNRNGTVEQDCAGKYCWSRGTNERTCQNAPELIITPPSVSLDAIKMQVILPGTTSSVTKPFSDNIPVNSQITFNIPLNDNQGLKSVKLQEKGSSSQLYPEFEIPKNSNGLPVKYYSFNSVTKPYIPTTAGSKTITVTVKNIHDKEQSYDLPVIYVYDSIQTTQPEQTGETNTYPGSQTAAAYKGYPAGYIPPND